ncbi:MAG: caspase family protein [Actinomycetota bacterium]|nr:caspase family protein [Actinomycetota bacterium]
MRGKRAVVKLLLILVLSGVFCAVTLAAAPAGEVKTSCGRTGWYFAEGYTGGDFDTWILIQNPNEEETVAHLRFITPNGEPITHDYGIAGESRFTVYLNEVPGLESMEVSTEVVCEGDGIVAERAMYFNYNSNGDSRAGGHASIGATSLSGCWYLPEGYTGGGFDTYVLLMNPNDEPAENVHLKLMKPDDGRYYAFKVDVPAGRRVTVKLDDLVYMEGQENKIPGGVSAAHGEGGEEESTPVYFNDTNVSTYVCSSKGIVAERAMYFDYQGKVGGSSSIGATSAQPEWYLPEGYTGGEFDTYILAMNPNSYEVDITYTFFSNQAGFEPVNVTHTDVKPYSRDTIHVDDVPGLEGTDISTKVTATRDVVLQAAGAEVDKYAVLYGVDEYEVDPLKYAVDDMYDIKHRLVNYCGFDYSNMRYRADEYVTVEQFQKDMEWLAETAGPEDLVFFFFGGKSSEGAENFLELFDGEVSDAELAAYFDVLQTQKLVGLLSADNSGEFFTELEAPGRLLMASCAKGEDSHEFADEDFKAATTECGNGAFAYYFVEALSKETADTSGNGFVSAEEAFAYLQDKVTDLVNEKTGVSQVPQISDNIEGDVDLTVDKVQAGIVAERSMYFNYYASSDGHTSIGTPTTYRRWNLAEGYTGGGFDTYVLVVNPYEFWQKVTATFMTPGGETIEKEYEVPPMFRLTIHVDEADPALASTDVSTGIYAEVMEQPGGTATVSCEDSGVAVERAMYFVYTDPHTGAQVRGGSCSIGYGSW